MSGNRQDSFRFGATKVLQKVAEARITRAVSLTTLNANRSDYRFGSRSRDYVRVHKRGRALLALEQLGATGLALYPRRR